MPDVSFDSDRPPANAELDVPSGRPAHPGVILAELILPNWEMTTEDLSERTGIAHEDVQALVKGDVKVNEYLREMLRKAFDEGADVLFEQQKAFDYFLEHKRRPPPLGPY